MLDVARTAITEGDAQRGLDRLEQHRRLFPNALLTEERDALQVQALVKAARYDKARARAGEFRRRTPGSLFLPAVDAAIASIP
jgi:outer membrane protein assembly factor BamD (BamD/ComL family)